MAYHVVDPEDVEPLPDRDATARSISDHVGLATLGLRRYAAAPGEQLPLTYHVHEEQEEAFFVTEGELHVETPEREYVIPAGRVFIAEPKSPHRAFNPEDAEGEVLVLAMGAPSVDDVSPYEP